MTNSVSPSHLYQWQGRDDVEDGELGQRVHHVMQIKHLDELTQASHSVALVGFECDAGVERNKGRIGAKHAPNLIKQALANLAWHHTSSLCDLGNIHCHDDDLEQAQLRCAQLIADGLDHSPVIVLGGGHEVAWASFQGLGKYLLKQGMKTPKIAIINFDAHFDLRSFSSEKVSIKPSSGTPFMQIADHCQQIGWDFHYACLGVSRANNTTALFQRADQLGVWYVDDKTLNERNHAALIEKMDAFIADCDYLYLTIDLDVFPAATAPGVSAPAAQGVSLDNFHLYFDHLLQNHISKLLIADLAEYNPSHDIDNQTARLAARLCWEIASAMTEYQEQQQTMTSNAVEASDDSASNAKSS
ncbi:formimidoylglutamase [Vibrio metschnikovii]|uniref:formimidoylglutamase n=1 Tax=Vibrio metschnikovii TaxID=28172 RepID=UPI001C307B13|nr:formimidoylglutamase [Vibrio metschnikovii]